MYTRRSALTILFVTYLILFALPSQAQSQSPTHRALLVAVNGYKHVGTSKSPYAELDTVADVEAIKKTLIQRFGFAENDILVLSKPETTTHEAILKAFRDHLMQDAHPGDTRYFHFSGHGSNAYDRAGLLHRTLVPSDWKTQTKDAPGGNEITDNEVGKIVSELKSRLHAGQPGEQKSAFLLSFDCCYSGRLVADVRGGGGPKVRGRDPLFPPVQPDTPTPPLTSNRETSEGIVSLAPGFERGFVALMACRYREEAVQMTPPATARQKFPPTMGLFTFCLTRALDAATPTTTYRDIWERVRSEMVKLSDHPQTPVIEGDQDNYVLGKTARNQDNYLPIIVRQSKDTPPQAVLLAGRVQGMTAGSRFDLYKAGTSDFSKSTPIHQAQIADVSLTESTLQILDAQGKPLRLSAAIGASLEAARAKEKAHRYTDSPIRIELSSAIDGAAAQRLREYMTAQKSDSNVGVIVAAGEAAEYRIITRAETSVLLGQMPEANEPTYVVVRLPSGERVGTLVNGLRNGASLTEQFTALLERLYRFRTVAALSVNENQILTLSQEASIDGIALQARLVPITVAPNDPNQQLTATNVKFVARLDTEGHPTDAVATPLAKREWIDGDWFAMEVRNRGNRPAYLSVLNLTSDGAIASIYPEGKAERDVPDDGKWHYITWQGDPDHPRPFYIRPPFGNEILKFIATEEWTDFGNIVDSQDTRGPDTEGRRNAEEHPLGLLLRRVSQGKRTDVTDLETARMATVTLPLNTTSKKP